MDALTDEQLARIAADRLTEPIIPAEVWWPGDNQPVTAVTGEVPSEEGGR